MKIEINNLDTHFTIDTYAIFNGESIEEDLTFNHSAIVEQLAKKSINYIFNECNFLGIINDITFLSSISPKFYNYTTDSFDMSVDFNSEKLTEYIVNNELEKQVNERLESYTDEEKENILHARLVVFMENELDEEKYINQMLESETEIYLNNSL